MFTVPTVSDVLDAEIQQKIDLKTKPRGSLGVVETLARQICRVQKTLTPKMETCALTIFAGDHGVVAEGVSAFPQEVTPQMVLNFLAGGAAANVFARTNGVSVQVVDAGIAGESLDHPDLISRRIGAGTANFLNEPAMSAGQTEQALAAGVEIGTAMPGEAAAFGEMGIGNTSSATLIAHKLTGLPVAEVTGRGTGVADKALDHKRDVLERAAARTGKLDALDALREYGGFEVAGMAGGMIGAAQSGKIVLVDGFIATAAALVRSRPGAEPVRLPGLLPPVRRGWAQARSRRPEGQAAAASRHAAGRGHRRGAGLALAEGGGGHGQRHGELRIRRGQQSGIKERCARNWPYSPRRCGSLPGCRCRPGSSTPLPASRRPCVTIRSSA